MDKLVFNQGMLLLQAHYGKISTELTNSYAYMFRDMNDADFTRAVELTIKNYEFNTFPKPAIIFKYAGADEDSRARNAIMILKRVLAKFSAYDSIDFDDRVLHAVIEKFGGLEEIVTWSENDWSLKERHFIESYNSCHNTGIKGDQYIIGIHEKNNRLNGHEEYIKAPYLIIKKENGKLARLLSPKNYALEYKKRDKGELSHIGDTTTLCVANGNGLKIEDNKKIVSNY